MKTRTPISPQGVIKHHPGFALVVTVALLVLLSLIAVGLLTLSTVTVRSGGHGSAQAQARANARVALLMAIGDLQKYAGPDTRITANANLLNANSPNPYWTGVWASRPGEALATGQTGTYPVGHHRSSQYLSDNRNGKKPSDPIRWLVSSPDASGPSPDTATGDASVMLLDTGRPESSVLAPLLPININGSCAWWVSDENQKALVNLPDRHQDAPNRSHYSLVAAQDYDFETYETKSPPGTPLAGHGTATPERLDRVPSLATAGLLPLNDPEAFRKSLPESYHHLTAHSEGLFTDVKNSGLKRDLSAFLAVGDIAEDPVTGQAGLQEDDTMLTSRHHRLTSPRFGILKGWADLADQLDSGSGPAAITPQAPNTYFQNLDGSAPGPVRDLTAVSKPAIQPVVVEASLGWDFSPYSPGGGSADFLRGHIYPRVILWNPFNVTLKPTRYLAMLRHPRYGSFTARNERINTRSDRLYFDDLCGAPRSAFLGFVTEATELLPGETKVFTPAIGASSGLKLSGKAAAFDPLNYEANVLTADQIPGVENFHFDSNTPLPPETSANRFAPYGFSANMNSFYSTPGYSDEFIVAQVAEGVSGPITWREATTDNNSFPRVAHFLCQNWGLNRYHKWYGAEKNDHPSNNGTPFREFKPGARDIGAIENRRQPRLWRRGVRMAWFDDEAEYIACNKAVPKARFTHPWFSSSNIRGGLFHHSSWLNIPFAKGWQFPASDGHMFFRQPTDPQLLSNFFPPSPIAAPDDGFPSTCTIYDIPRRETGIISLGQLQHAQLSYATWHPSFVIGHSQSTMNADLDATAVKRAVVDRNRWTGDKPWDYDTIIQNGGGRSAHRGEVLIYDLCFEANEALWDRFMLSSIPYEGSPDNRSAAWNPDAPLPVGRYTFNDHSRNLDRDTVADELSSNPSYPYFRAAEFLVNRGAFNINSTSTESWKALLGSMRGLERGSLDGSASQSGHPLSRSVITQSPGVDSIASATDPAAWNGFRTLSDDDIAILADEIVEQVRKRGPFVSIADFVNRRLVEDADLGGAGAIDQAIKNSSVINSGLERRGLTDLSEVGEVATAANRSAAITYGAPGFVTQGDILTAIAPVITARGDTFKIRAYGEAPGPNGTIARAWCEAVVQRGVDYIDDDDDPASPAIEYSDEISVGALSAANLTFGRRFRIQSFRWLSGTEFQPTS